MFFESLIDLWLVVHITILYKGIHKIIKLISKKLVMQYWWSNVWCFMICVCFMSTRFVVLWTLPFRPSNVWHLLHQHWFHFKLSFRVWCGWSMCCFASNGSTRCFMSTWSFMIDYLASLASWTLFCFKGLGFGASDLCVVLWALFCFKGLRFRVGDLCITLWTLDL
jgi:hypothetical protein